jgi:hypothetical protein
MTGGAVRPVLVAARSPPPDTRPRICRPVSPRSLPPTSGPLFRSRFSWGSAVGTTVPHSFCGATLALDVVTVVGCRPLVRFVNRRRRSSLSRSPPSPSSSSLVTWSPLVAVRGLRVLVAFRSLFGRRWRCPGRHSFRRHGPVSFSTWSLLPWLLFLPSLRRPQSRRRARCHGDADRVTAGGFVTFPRCLYRRSIGCLLCFVMMTGVASRRRSLSGRSRTLGLPPPPVAAWRGLVRIGHCFLAPLVP